MEVSDLLISTVRDIRSNFLQSSEDGAEPAIAALTKDVNKHPEFEGQKISQAMVKKALREIKRKQMEVEVEAPAQEPPRQPTQAAIEANGGKPPANPFDTAAIECVVYGDGLHRAAPMHVADFTIEARDATGALRPEGGDAFFVAIRGASRVRARIFDNNDGTYKVEWKPPQSGQYQVAVSYFGMALPGSPWTLHATTPIPHASNCIVKGSALYNAVARAVQTFQIKYKDKLNNTAHAVDLDVYVEPLPPGSPRGKTSPLGSRPPDAEHDGEYTDRGNSPHGERAGGEEQRAFGKAAPPRGPPPQQRQVVALPPPPQLPEEGELSAEMSRLPTMADGSTYDLPEAASGEGSTFVRNRTIRVKVGSVPLVVRAKQDILSPQLGTVLPGQMVTVLREVISSGKVRAMIALDSVSKSPEASQILVSRPATPVENGPPSTAVISARAVKMQDLAPEGSIGPDPSALSEGDAIAEDAPGNDSEYDVAVAAAAIVEDEGSTYGNVGWVTLLKDGKKLVTSRVRQSAGSRQQHERQWVRRLANDKAAKVKVGVKTSHTVSLELSSDPTGIGFAFGGVHPGTLHARGHLHETHQVSYSIGLVGEYLLHVRLRQQAAALPGSPFRLIVMPGPADAGSTKLPKQSIVGTVGMEATAGCGILITTADVMGNACVNGGAKVTGDSFGSHVEVISNIEDRGDGSYYLKWNSQKSGTFQVAVKIDDAHVVGSPTSIKLISTLPELNKSELLGDGLSQAIAGKPSQFNIKFSDTFGNSAIPKDSFKVCIALLKTGEKNKEAKIHEKFDMVEIDQENGLYECSYTAEKDGNYDLHVWAEDRDPLRSRMPTSTTADAEAKAERNPFPGSPFHCVVSPGAASPQRSIVEGWQKESRTLDKHGKAVQQDTNNIIAGDSVIFQPKICDELGNLATLPEGSLDVNLVYPDGTSHNMSSSSNLKFTNQSKGGITMYSIRHEATHAGEHHVHIRLHGQAIQGSPVVFKVHESTADVKMCQLTAPPEFPLYSSNTYTIVLKTFDRFNNPMSHGGLPVVGRLQLIKSGVHDLTTLMPNNNTVDVEDLGDGTYHIKVALIKITATVKVIVNMDKNIPAGGGELSPIQLTFLPPEGAEEAAAQAAEAAPVADAEGEAHSIDPKTKNQKLRGAGSELMQMMGVGQEGMRAKSSIAVAAEAFEEAGQQARRNRNPSKEAVA